MAALINNRYNFIINGKSYAAKSMKYDWESLATEDSGRTLDGTMHIYWVKPNIRKLEIVMPPCTEDTIYSIINAVQGKQYNITYYDPAYKSTRTIYVYTSNASADMYNGVVMNGLWQDFSFNAIEV